MALRAHGTICTDRLAELERWTARQAITEHVFLDVDAAGLRIAEIIHMDENGAVKFPADRLEEVVTKAKALLAEEDERVGNLLKARGVEEVRAIMSGHAYTSKSK